MSRRPAPTSSPSSAPAPAGTRDEATITNEIATARAEYHLAAATEPAPQLRARAEGIKALMAELSAFLAHGALPCPGCGHLPHGHLKTPPYVNHGRIVPPVYEVRCLVCGPGELPSASPRERRIVRPSACGETPGEAVAAWNAGDRVVILELA